MQLNPAAFAAHLNCFAEPVLYRRAFACPCVNPASGSPKANCPQCAGKGWLWTAPVNATVAVASSSVQLEWARMGNYESGDLVLSIPHTSKLYGIAMFDRVTQKTSTDQRSLVLTRGGPKERLTGSVKEVTRVFWFDAASAVVEGALPTVDASGAIVWPAAGAPPAGQSYSITFIRYADYFCFGQLANDRNKHGGLPLPRKMVLRRFDLLGRTPSPTTV